MDDKIVKAAACLIVGSVVTPVIIGCIGGTVKIVGNAIIKTRFNHKIKKGLKDGSIIEIDGHYYEVDVVSAVEEA